ncbi:Dot/Icm secretion system protein IcmQ [Legionella hackeliae]|uniref:IcmQ n=1 Tax=Legionella hackeliae TaxID=449 RepID=Q49L40_LEGHA|nr:Dot/Icm secretion system protein IcmQ [Legionella hackeliae]AAX12528.1 IcmQ [Legionella hackeliae]KTD15225.1 IcmQ protein [Legionella hackeliae]CEK11411.1 protein secretion of Dot/Icm secretion system [Legionella hackeliae]STX48182.1 IcmQ protein [Legionella hackeliae]
MKDKLTSEQAQAILQALDDTIEKGPWEESNFLRVIGKNLREIRQNFANSIGNATEAPKSKVSGSAERSALSGQQEVFIGLYSTEGNNIQAWERILANLPRQMISRPIYINEQDVKNLIKSKENKINEAYVAAYINQSDILQVAPDKAPMDRFGRPLLALKDRSLSLDNVLRFVHLSGVYRYTKGRLVKNSSQE